MQHFFQYDFGLHAKFTTSFRRKMRAFKNVLLAGCPKHIRVLMKKKTSLGNNPIKTDPNLNPNPKHRMENPLITFLMMYLCKFLKILLLMQKL